MFQPSSLGKPFKFRELIFRFDVVGHFQFIVVGTNDNGNRLCA